jgi:hypothetical protein
MKSRLIMVMMIASANSCQNFSDGFPDTTGVEARERFE